MNNFIQALAALATFGMTLIVLSVGQVKPGHPHFEWGLAFAASVAIVTFLFMKYDA